MVPLLRSQMRRAAVPTRAFSLVETLIACGVICIFVIGATLAMTQMNRYATAARLRTLALAVAQQRIDEILTAPWQLNAARPAVLAAGSRTENNLALGADSFNQQAILKSAFTKLAVPVNATRITEITDTAPRRLRAGVIVRYTYRGRLYEVAMSTLRVTDNI